MTRASLAHPLIDGFRVTDLHIHIQPWSQLSETARATMAATRSPTESEAIARYMEDPASFVAALDAWGINRAALINYVSPDVIGFDESANDWVSAYCNDYRERLIPCGSVNPHRVADAHAARKEAERLVSTLEIAMLKLHPAHQLVWPDAYRADSRGARGHPPTDRPYGQQLEAIYETCIDHGVPLMVHTGTSVFPHAMNASCDPLILDAVAVDFPRLTILAAHAGRPLWGDHAAFVARRHPNLYLDLSGIPPKNLLRHLPDLPRLAHKCVWGTDWPGPGLPEDAPRGNVEAFLSADLGLDDAAKAAILDGNSRRIVP